MTLRDPKKKLETCHADIIKLVHLLAKEMDILVACGHRTKEEQNDAYKRGNSKLKFPKSGHNSWPSRAVDITPWPLDWQDHKSFKAMQARIREIAQEHGIMLEPLIDWDLPHVEKKR